MQSRVLIVDDDREMREALDIVFSADGHACELAADATAALELVHHRTFDVVVCDVRMQGMDGLALLDRVKVSHPALPFVVITAAGGVEEAVSAVKRGAFEYVLKPCEADDLRRIVAGALVERRHRSDGVRRALPLPTQGHPELVGEGPAMQALRTTIEFVARSSASVLLTGETGVGKEL